MVPKPPQARVQGAARLPPLPKFRIKRPNQGQANPCTSIMSSLLGCWASSGYNVASCALIEQQLRACMDANKSTTTKKNTINYHLNRMYPNMVGPRKRDK